MTQGNKRILVTGSNGQLGCEIRELAPEIPEFDFLFTDLPDLNITSETDVARVFKAFKPDLLINCAAYAAVDAAEDDELTASLVNATGASIIAKACKKMNCTLFHISTDYVFDGTKGGPYTESDLPNPLSVYGRTKLAAERLLKEIGVNTLIVRTSWLYSSFGKNFVKTILRLSQTQSQIRVVNDQLGTTTYARDLAHALIHIARNHEVKSFGIYHYANLGSCTWFGFAKAILTYIGSDCEVVPIATKEYPTKALRPSDSRLDSSALCRKFGLSIPYWEESLQQCLDKLVKTQ